MKNKIREYREKANMSQQDLADEIKCYTNKNLSKMAISHYESERFNPSVQTARAIVTVINMNGVDCTFNDIFPE